MNVVSLYDESGNALRPWAEVGFNCFCVDIQNVERSERVGAGWLHFINADMLDPRTHANVEALTPLFMAAFPPCTDLAVSGSKHFEAKAKANPNFQADAMKLVMAVPELGERCGCPWFFENPVSVISSMWRKPDFVFHPWQFDGYLPEDDTHPRWPDYIMPRDAYPKKTCIWHGNGFVEPWKRPVSVAPGYSAQFNKLGGKSAKTKQIRSETPRGFAKAVFEFNARKVFNRWQAERAA